VLNVPEEIAELLNAVVEKSANPSSFTRFFAQFIQTSSRDPYEAIINPFIFRYQQKAGNRSNNLYREEVNFHAAVVVMVVRLLLPRRRVRQRKHRKGS
jgi:hypothetical protein